jgi:hypothetical protein
MKLLALLAPVAILGALWALERLEAWMSHPLGHPGREARRGVARTRTTRSAMRQRAD